MILNKMKKGYLIIVLIITLSVVNYIKPSNAQMNDDTQIKISVKTSPESEFETSLNINSNKFFKGIANGKEISHNNAFPFSDTYLTLKNNKNYTVDDEGNLFDIKTSKKITLDQKVRAEIKKYVSLLKSIHYGDLLSWREVDEIIPRKSIFEVIDLESGLSFKVQRRAGNKHADVQPLTYRDTKILKEIYQGKWSWKRKAVLIKTENKIIAGSMHGMPHGIGTIRNGFPGHFCIHFFESTTHRTKNLDPTHQIMVYKASGKIKDFINSINPYDLIDVFLMGINQKDEYLLKMLFSNNANYQLPETLIAEMDNIVWISKVSDYQELNIENSIIIDVLVNVVIYRKGQIKEKRKIDVILIRDSLVDPWKISSETNL